MGATLEIGPFTGLDLNIDPLDGGTRALDISNIEILSSRIRSRQGYTSLYDTGGSEAVRHIQSTHVDGEVLFSHYGTNTTVRVVNAAGTSQGTFTDNTATFVSRAVPYFDGTSANSCTYVTSTVSAAVRKWNGGAFSTPANVLGAGAHVAVQQPDNRLVVVTSTGTATIYFSGAGTPESFGATDLVRFGTSASGTGKISGLASFNGQLFAFQQFAFHVFYGNTTASDGSAVFNYKTVPGVGCILDDGLTGNGVAADESGVYFVGPDGIYVTTGGQPQKISRPIDRIFDFSDTDMPSGFNGSAIYKTDLQKVHLSVGGGRLYFTYPTVASSGASRATMVWDRALNAWSYYDWPVYATLTDFQRVPNSPHRMWLGTAGKLMYSDRSLTTDNGSAITAKYRTNWMDVSTPEAEKVIRELILEGSGAVNVKKAVNGGSLGSATSVTLGTAPVIGQARERNAIRGRNFSVEFSTSSGAWSLSRAVANVSAMRSSGLKA